MKRLIVCIGIGLSACSGPEHGKVFDGLGEILTIGHEQFAQARLHSLADEFDTPVALEHALHGAVHHVAKHRPPGATALIVKVIAIGPDFKTEVPWATVQIDYSQSLKIGRSDNALRFISRIRFNGENSQAAARRYCLDAEPSLTGSIFCQSARTAGYTG